MVLVEVDIEIEDYLDEVSLEALQEEISDRRRRAESTRLIGVGGVELWTPSGLADDLRTAFYARNASRFEMLLTVLQPHERTEGLHQPKAATGS
jgi:hypothetical protein